jgi:hypothetical protein
MTCSKVCEEKSPAKHGTSIKEKFFNYRTIHFAISFNVGFLPYNKIPVR